MNLKEIGGIPLFRPQLEVEALARHEAERHLRNGYPSGTYTDPQKINEILKYQFGHFHSVLNAEIRKSASRDLIEFLLGQYDGTAQIEAKFKGGQLSDGDTAYWAERGPEIRRSLKHLAELVTSLAPSEAPKLAEGALLHNLEIIVICGEMLVELYILSDQTYGLHPDETSFTIFPEGSQIYWELAVDDSNCFSDFAKRVSVDAKRRSEHITGKELCFDLDYQGAELDSAFHDEFGFTYRDAIQVLRHLIDTAVVPDIDSFDTPFVRRDLIINALNEDKKWHKDSVARLLAGFSVTKAGMKQEGRVIYKPKQEYRAFRRGFLEMPHDSGIHLAWSRTMARECLLMLMDGTLFQRFPQEWRSSSVNKALAQVQKKAGIWFEAQVDRSMSSLGAVGRASLKDGIGMAADRIVIPTNIGELDYVGYFASERLLVILEDKMVDSGLEPSYLRDDISSFVTGSKPYQEQLRRKFEWVRDNVADICTGLSSVLQSRPSISPVRVAGALVTLYPTYASYFIKDYPCVALSELMTAYAEKDCWPYGIGVLDLV